MEGDFFFELDAFFFRQIRGIVFILFFSQVRIIVSFLRNQSNVLIRKMLPSVNLKGVICII